jgi:hypothetical protein
LLQSTRVRRDSNGPPSSGKGRQDEHPGDCDRCRTR